MKKLKNFLITIFGIILILIAVATVTKSITEIFNTTVYADVGSFEDYSSGSDWGRLFMGQWKFMEQ